jgi:hypothetical protein
MLPDTILQNRQSAVMNEAPLRYVSFVLSSYNFPLLFHERPWPVVAQARQHSAVAAGRKVVQEEWYRDAPFTEPRMQKGGRREWQSAKCRLYSFVKMGMFFRDARGMKMPMYEEPVVGAFYADREEDGRTFEVIAFDENDGTIEIQYGDGTTDEIDLDDWYGMDLEQLESEEEEDEAEDIDDSDAADEDDTDLDDDEGPDEDED